jgi:hypothetical protein
MSAASKRRRVDGDATGSSDAPRSGKVRTRLHIPVAIAACFAPHLERVCEVREVEVVCVHFFVCPRAKVTPSSATPTWSGFGYGPHVHAHTPHYWLSARRGWYLLWALRCHLRVRLVEVAKKASCATLKISVFPLPRADELSVCVAPLTRAHVRGRDCPIQHHTTTTPALASRSSLR